MSYRVAIASSDEVYVNETFGTTNRFLIFEISDGHRERLEDRRVKVPEGNKELASNKDCNRATCGTSGGCGGDGAISAKVTLIEDCRCVVCKKIGFQILKQLERKAIGAFDVSCTVEEVLDKLVFYFSHIDNHLSLRKTGE